MPYNNINNESTLKIKIKTCFLKVLLDLAEENFFNYIYDKTDLSFVSQKKKFFFSQEIKLDRTASLAQYKKMDFQIILKSLIDPTYNTMFRNYTLLYHLHQTDTVEIPIEDLKFFLNISDISFQEIIKYAKQ